ncbi:MAG: SpoIID/LytB domain-containing protein [Bacteroidales bacterium]|jgi:stage II sporulation protein D|nr:SpoIID/LytB domain-containing protein [Bacteroidales bacterium]
MSEAENTLRYTALVAVMLFLSVSLAAGQVKVRLFASQTPDFAVFTVVAGEYTLDGNGTFGKNDIIVISRYNGRMAVKPRQAGGFVADTVMLRATSDSSSFMLRVSTQTAAAQRYTGHLVCYPDMATMVMINSCPLNDYIAGTVRTEGGANRHGEFIKTQAIITRTYLYRHMDRHTRDGYNVCDNTHCQAFHGITDDAAINRATAETSGMVILDGDSALINSAFHSNCGGMTAASEDVWVSRLPYLRSVADPWCVNSRNASWERKLTLGQWVACLQSEGYTGQANNTSLFSFQTQARAVNYQTGTFHVPLETIRQHLRLRSSYFSVETSADTVTLKGRGYGHGVGLCQEGAMQMAARGKTASQIISFYYTGVTVASLKNARPETGQLHGK